MKKSLIFTFLLTCFTLTMHAQIRGPERVSFQFNRDSLGIEIADNDPDYNSRSFAFMTGIYTQRDNTPNIIGHLAYARQTPNYRFSSVIGLTTIWEPYKTSHNIKSVYGRGLHWNSEIKYTYYFKKWFKPHEFLVPLYVISRLRRSTKYAAVEVDGEKGLRLGLDAGLLFGTNFYMLEGTTLIGTDLNANQYLIDDDLPGLYSQSTFQDIAFLKFGISYTSISRMIINTNPYGERGSFGGYMLSLNGFFSLRNSYDDVFARLDGWDPYQINGTEFNPLIYGEDIYLRLDINENSELSPFGVSLKIQNLSAESGSTSGLMSAETGIYPGEKGGLYNRFFVLLKMGLWINR